MYALRLRFSLLGEPLGCHKALIAARACTGSTMEFIMRSHLIMLMHFILFILMEMDEALILSGSVGSHHETNCATSVARACSLVPCMQHTWHESASSKSRWGWRDHNLVLISCAQECDSCARASSPSLTGSVRRRACVHAHHAEVGVE